MLSCFNWLASIAETNQHTEKMFRPSVSKEVKVATVTQWLTQQPAMDLLYQRNNFLAQLGDNAVYIFIRNNAFQSCFADSKFHSFLPFNTCPLKIHKTQESETPTAISFEMYYFSCESFSWNYKLCITSEQLGPKFPNHESQTSLKHLIYLSVFSQAFFFFPATC